MLGIASQRHSGRTGAPVRDHPHGSQSARHCSASSDSRFAPPTSAPAPQKARESSNTRRSAAARDYTPRPFLGIALQRFHVVMHSRFRGKRFRPMMGAEANMDAKTFAREVESHVRPATFPVAAKLLSPDEPLPEKAKRPWRDMKIQIAMSRQGRLAFSGNGSSGLSSF